MNNQDQERHQSKGERTWHIGRAPVKARKGQIITPRTTEITGVICTIVFIIQIKNSRKDSLENPTYVAIEHLYQANGSRAVTWTKWRPDKSGTLTIPNHNTHCIVIYSTVLVILRT